MKCKLPRYEHLDETSFSLSSLLERFKQYAPEDVVFHVNDYGSMELQIWEEESDEQYEKRMKKEHQKTLKKQKAILEKKGKGLKLLAELKKNMKTLSYALLLILLSSCAALSLQETCLQNRDNYYCKPMGNEQWQR